MVTQHLMTSMRRKSAHVLNKLEQKDTKFQYGEKFRNRAIMIDIETLVAGFGLQR